MTEEVKGKNRIGKIIQDFRTQNDLTQQDFADLVNYRYGNFIGMIEKGKSQFPLAKGKWLDYAKALNMDPTEILLISLGDVFPEMASYLDPVLELYKKKSKK